MGVLSPTPQQRCGVCFLRRESTISSHHLLTCNIYSLVTDCRRWQRFFFPTSHKRRLVSAARKDHDGEHRGNGGSSGMLFADFISSTSKEPADERVMDELIEKTSGVLQEAVDALARVRERDQKDQRHDGVKKSNRPSGGGIVRYRNPRFVPMGSPVASPPPALLPESDGGELKATGLDGWFRGKVEAGALMERKTKEKYQGLAFKEKDVVPDSLVFSGPVAPEESVKGLQGVFPEHLALRFHSDVFTEFSEAKVEEKLPEEDKVVQSTTTSGEEFGDNGYWYRWTEVSGENESGSVVWTERWWEISDWSGMKELGAEKYGINDVGDAWRETWTEKITIDTITRKPMVSRDAHKWARASNNQEWEEKWSEMYWSGGKTEKWADKWGRDGHDVWHETWGENYDGSGGCVKWTDRWAESPNYDNPSILNKWGDKWREEFKDGTGEKTGETWQETVHTDGLGDGHKYQRWWGERHAGNGSVQKFGNSTTGEHWDVTEQMDTYYNPIPHFGYDLALSHSPQLHEVPVLPRDDILDLDFE